MGAFCWSAAVTIALGYVLVRIYEHGAGVQALKGWSESGHPWAGMFAAVEPACEHCARDSLP
jgi:hypothetical protein